MLTKNEKIQKGKGSFNIILSNPPFGAKVNFDELESFKDYKFGGENRNQQASDILFIERNIDFLQPDFFATSTNLFEFDEFSLPITKNILQF